jgi:hypothetical protein
VRLTARLLPCSCVSVRLPQCSWFCLNPHGPHEFRHATPLKGISVYKMGKHINSLIRFVGFMLIQMLFRESHDFTKNNKYSSHCLWLLTLWRHLSAWISHNSWNGIPSVDHYYMTAALINTNWFYRLIATTTPGSTTSHTPTATQGRGDSGLVAVWNFISAGGGLLWNSTPYYTHSYKYVLD